jgi:hypothetical protein
MRLKNTFKTLRTIPYFLMLGLLTIGASLILGFLSFSGMYALWPLLPLAIGAFALSVAYEGEIYLQNIKGAFNKLFLSHYLSDYLAKEYLLTFVPNALGKEGCPEFFNDYLKQVELLHVFGHKTLNQEGLKRKKHIEKTLRDMERWFAGQLFPKENTLSSPTKYAEDVQEFLGKNKQEAWQATLKRRNIVFHLVKAFSIVSGFFMGLGTTYLIVEAFSVIPLMAAIPFGLWPILIVPMAVIAGTAYGLLTYNAVTDLINNDTIRKWYYTLKKGFVDDGLSLRNVFLVVTTISLVTLAIALTICTAGTWWTIAKNATPLFGWMSKLPSFIMGVVNPLITGSSALFFNAGNTLETLGLLKIELEQKNVFVRIYEYVLQALKHIGNTENFLQILNPFRFILKLIIIPLRILLFLGHLISVGLTADRVPGIPQIIALIVAVISEGFEDAHYFLPHSHGHHGHNPEALLKEHLGAAHGHNHDLDIPTRILKVFFTPLYLCATLWDVAMSQLNPKTKPVLDLKTAWWKQWGAPVSEGINPDESAEYSKAWQKEHALFLIERYTKNHLDKAVIGQTVASEKKVQLSALESKIRDGDKLKLSGFLKDATQDPVWKKHRYAFFAQENEPTDTQEFVEGLSERVGLSI